MKKIWKARRNEDQKKTEQPSVMPIKRRTSWPQQLRQFQETENIRVFML